MSTLRWLPNLALALALAACASNPAPAALTPDVQGTVSAMLTQAAPPPTAPLNNPTPLPTFTPTNPAPAGPTPTVTPVPALVQKLESQAGAVFSLAFHPNGALLAAGTERGVQIWNTNSNQLARSLPELSWVNGVAYSPDGTQLAAVYGTDKVWLADASGNFRGTLEGQGGLMVSVAFSPRDSLIAATSVDTTIRVWRTDTGEYQRALPGHTAKVNSVAFSPDGARLASGSSDGTVRVYDPRDSNLLLRIFGARLGPVMAVALTPNGRQVAAADDLGRIAIWDLDTGDTVGFWETYGVQYTSLAFNPLNGAQLAAASRDGAVYLWDVPTSGLIARYADGSAPVYGVAYSPSGQTLASASADGLIRLWAVTP